MPVHNADIASAFEEIADLLELGDENPFRVRALHEAKVDSLIGAAISICAVWMLVAQSL